MSERMKKHTHVLLLISFLFTSLAYGDKDARVGARGDDGEWNDAKKLYSDEFKTTVQAQQESDFLKFEMSQIDLKKADLNKTISDWTAVKNKADKNNTKTIAAADDVINKSNAALTALNLEEDGLATKKAAADATLSAKPLDALNTEFSAKVTEEVANIDTLLNAKNGKSARGEKLKKNILSNTVVADATKNSQDYLKDQYQDTYPADVKKFIAQSAIRKPAVAPVAQSTAAVTSPAAAVAKPADTTPLNNAQTQSDYCTKTLKGTVTDDKVLCQVEDSYITLATLGQYQVTGKTPEAVQKFLAEDSNPLTACLPDSHPDVKGKCEDLGGAITTDTPAMCIMNQSGTNASITPDNSSIDGATLCGGPKKNKLFAQTLAQAFGKSDKAAPVSPAAQAAAAPDCTQVQIELTTLILKNKDSEILANMTQIAALKVAIQIVEKNKPNDPKNKNAHLTLEDYLNKMRGTITKDPNAKAFQASLLNLYQTYGDENSTPPAMYATTDAYHYFKGNAAKTGGRVQNDSASAFLYYLSQHPTAKSSADDLTDVDAAAVWAQQKIFDQTINDGFSRNSLQANSVNFSTQVYAKLNADANKARKGEDASIEDVATTDPAALRDELYGPEGATADLKSSIEKAVLQLDSTEKIACFKTDDGSSCVNQGAKINIGASAIKEVEQNLIRAIRAPASSP
jgi:hypothetical protein